MEVSPKVLEFGSDFSQPNTREVTLTNNTSQVLAYKVKTNASKVYSVKSNLNKVEPKQSTTVKITLPPLKSKLPSNYKSNHKFLIVSLPFPEGESLSSFSNLESQFKSEVSSTQIKVNYSLAKLGGAAGAGAGAKLNGKSKRISKFVPNGSAVENGASRSNSSAGTAAGAAAAAGAAGAAMGAGAGYAASTPTRNKNVETPSRQQSNEQLQPVNRGGYFAGSTPSSPAYGGGNAGLVSKADLSRDFERLYSQNERLGKKLENLEKLAILTLMLLSFILGKLMV